jgi:AraC-like DNA-binding protein
MKNTSKNIKAVLQLFGYEKQEKPWFISAGSGIVASPQEPFRADFYVYAICTGGKAELSINNKEATIVPGDFFTAIPSTIVQVIKYSKSFRARVLIFERGFLLKNILDTRQLEHLGFFNLTTLAHVQLLKNEATQLQILLNHLQQRSLKDGLFHDEIIQSLIINLLFETAEIYFWHSQQKRQTVVSREEELFIQFSKLVPLHFRLQQPLQFYSNKLFISEKHLIRVCKNIAGKTPGAILAEAVVNEAKLLLNNPDNNIGLVSQSLRYASVSAFSKFFKNQTGMSPLAWRNR